MGTEEGRDGDATLHLDALAEDATALLDALDADLVATLQPTVLSATLKTADATATVVSGAAAESQPDGAPLRLTPGYDLRDVLGEGGMGVVHLARQKELRRDVAIKTLRGELAEKQSERQSFLAESMVTGALEHPNVVPIHAVSEHENGEIWLVMKRIQGSTLTELLEQQPPPRNDEQTEDLLRIVLGICNALAFAHSQGVIHRDIKPDNVMIGDYGEVLLVDWGIAVRFRETDDSSPLSAAPLSRSLSQIAGTPRFMPPELARGAGDEQGPWTDTHLVGGLLYQILGGEPPHRGRTLREVLLHAQTDAPAPLPDSVPQELRDICQKALAVERSARYSTATGLKEAIEEYLEHRESLLLSREAAEKMDSWRQSHGAGACQAGDEDRAIRYRDISQAISSYAHSALLWPGNEEAVRGEQEARLLMARAALEAGDLGIAQNNVDELDSEEGRELARDVESARRARRRVTRFARRLGAILIAIQALVLTALALFAGYEVKRFTDIEILEQLHRLMPAVSSALQQAETATSADLDRIADRLGRRNSLGIALVEESGSVLADSSTDPVGPQAAEARAEIRDALEIGEGSAIYRSPGRDDVISLAERWADDASEIQGVLVLSLPRGVLADELQPILVATSAAILLTFLISCFVILRATRILNESLRRAL